MDYKSIFLIYECEYISIKISRRRSRVIQLVDTLVAIGYFLLDDARNKAGFLLDLITCMGKKGNFEGSR